MLERIFMEVSRENLAAEECSVSLNTYDRGGRRKSVAMEEGRRVRCSTLSGIVLTMDWSYRCLRPTSTVSNEKVRSAIDDPEGDRRPNRAQSYSIDATRRNNITDRYLRHASNRYTINDISRVETRNGS